jgi:hypothetical protein
MIEVAPVLKFNLLYDEAWLYCATLTYDNHYDWRMPTSDEYYDACYEIDQDSYDESDEYRDNLIYWNLRTCPVRTIDN